MREKREKEHADRKREEKDKKNHLDREINRCMHKN
jgi:hypothetical protein